MFTRIKQAFSNLKISTDTVLYFLIALFVIIGPLAYIPVLNFPIAASKGFILFILIIVAVLVSSVHALRKGAITIPQSKIFIGLGGISLIALIGALCSPSFGVALFGYGFETGTWMFVTTFGLLALFSYQTIRSYRRAGIVYGGIIAAFLILAIIEIIRFITGPGVATFGVLTSTTSTLIGSWGDLGILFGLIVLFSGITLELAGLRRPIKWIVGSIGGLALAMLAFMNVSIVWVILGFISLVVTLYLFSFAYWDREEQKYRKESRMPWYMLTIFIIAIGGMFFGNFLNSVASRHENITWSGVRLSVPATTHVFVKSIVHNVATGYGPNMFSPAWIAIKPISLSGSLYSNADVSTGFGYVPSQIASQGILGAIVWIFFFVVLIIFVIRRMTSGFVHAIDRYFTILTGVLIIYLTIMAWAYVPGVYLLGLLAVLVGIFLGVSIKEGVMIPDREFSFIKDPRASFFGILGLLILMVGTFVGGYVGVRKMISFVHYTRAQNYLIQNDTKNALAEANVASAFAAHDLYRTLIANLEISNANNLVTTATATNKDTISAQVNSILGIALGNAEAAVAYNPSSYKNYLLLGNVYRNLVSLGVSDASDKATAAYKQAAVLDPNDATNDLNLAELALANKDTTTALSLVNSSLNKYATPDAYELKTQIEIGQQDFSDAETSLHAAVLLDSYNASLVYQYGLLLFSQKDYSDSIPVFQRAIILNPSVPAYVYLGVSYEKTSDFDSANKIYTFLEKHLSNADDLINQVKTGTTQAPAVTAPNQTSTTPQGASSSTPSTVKTPALPTPGKTVAPKPKKK